MVQNLLPSCTHHVLGVNGGGAHYSAPFTDAPASSRSRSLNHCDCPRTVQTSLPATVSTKAAKPRCHQSRSHTAPLSPTHGKGGDSLGKPRRQSPHFVAVVSATAVLHLLTRAAHFIKESPRFSLSTGSSLSSSFLRTTRYSSKPLSRMALLDEACL